MTDESNEQQMYAVELKDDCPHVETSLKIQESQIKILPCHACEDASENWICLECGAISCSRFVNGHAAVHNTQSGHSIALSFSDLSVWCYPCESYIKHPSLVNINRYAKAVKFYGEDFIESQKSTAVEEHINPSFLQKWEQTTALLQEAPKNVPQLIELIQKVGKITKAAADPLKHFFEKQLNETERASFFSTSLPNLLQKILCYPQVFPNPIPVLGQQKDAELILTRTQIAVMLSVSFMCMWDHPNYRYFPKRNFSDLYIGLKEESEAMKMRCILQYFETVFPIDLGREFLTFCRQVIPTDQLPNWETSEEPITELRFHKGSIEDVEGHLHADFANKYIGGGVLAGGCVQEELMFAENTELIAACLVLPIIQDNEAVILKGSKKFSTHTGYGYSARWRKLQEEQTREPGLKSSNEIVAMDAMDYRYASAQTQYYKDGFVRELNKAYVAFAIRHASDGPVATGNWGCGAFRGDKQYKAIIQLLAASKAGRAVTYCFFGEKELEESMTKIYTLLKENDCRIRNVYAALLEYQSLREKNETTSFFSFLEHYIAK